MKIRAGLWMKLSHCLRHRMLEATMEQQKERKKNRLVRIKKVVV